MLYQCKTTVRFHATTLRASPCSVEFMVQVSQGCFDLCPFCIMCGRESAGPSRSQYTSRRPSPAVMTFKILAATSTRLSCNSGSRSICWESNQTGVIDVWQEPTYSNASKSNLTSQTSHQPEATTICCVSRVRGTRIALTGISIVAASSRTRPFL